MNGQSLQNPFEGAFQAACMFLALLLLASLCFIMPPVMVIVPLAAAAYSWVIFRHPIGVLGALLAFMPIDYIAIELGKFFRLPQMTLVSACTKEIPFLLLIFILWRRNGFKTAVPDRFLFAFCGLATVYTIFEGTWAALALDLNFAVAYLVGRVTALKEEQERKWAVRAVWIVAVLALLGLGEVFLLGEGPRTALYLSTDAMTMNGGLGGSFHAMGFEGMREASTMVGPPSFGALCMIGLILWWIYYKNPLPAVMISVGLVCSLTRSAWLGVAVAIPLLAFTMHQQKRLFFYAAMALMLFVVSIPILGLGDYIFLSKTGQDLSAEAHQNEIANGLKYVAEHPFGSGNSKVSALASLENKNATVFETTYPSVAAKYGIPVIFCFVGFLFSALQVAWREKSDLGYAAVGILIGMGMVMAVTLPLDDRRLACWALFPVGLAVRSCVNSQSRFIRDANRTIA